MSEEMIQDLYQMYLEEIEMIVPCTEEELEDLALELLEGKQEAKNRLSEGCLKRALMCAAGYANRGVALSDLIQEANMALLEALESYEEGSLADHLDQQMKKALELAVEEEAAEHRVEEEVLARVNVLEEVTKQMAEALGREATLEELSERMKLPSDEIRDIMKMTLDAMSVTGES